MKYALCITSPDVERDFMFSMMSGSLEKKLADMAALGYSGIELLCGQPELCDYKRVLQACKSNSLEISDLSSGALYTVTGLKLLVSDKEKRIEAAKVFTAALDLAIKLGTDIITLGAFRGWARDVGTIADGEEILADLFLSLEPRLLDNNIRIAIEAVSGGETDIFNTCAQVVSFIKRNNLKNTGVLFDSYHADIADDNPLKTLEDLIDSSMLLHFHISDSERKIPGEGKIDFTALMRILLGKGYEGFLSGEIKSGENKLATGMAVIHNMKEFERCIQ